MKKLFFVTAIMLMTIIGANAQTKKDEKPKIK